MPADGGPIERHTQRPSARPLRRTPKQLTEEPTLFEAQPGKAGVALRAQKRGAASARAPQLPSALQAGFTDDPAELALIDEQLAVEPAARERARAIAAALAVPRPRAESSSRRGQGVLASLPYRGAADDIDLDATIEVLAERPVPEDEDIIVRDRIRSTRAVVLLVDVSGSSKGERMTTSAAAVGALASELERDKLAVIAFWSDAAVLLPIGAPVRPFELLDQLMRIPARGLTNLAFPLQLASEQLARSPERDSRVVLLSDCVHNAGPDPRPLAAALPRLDVLLDTSGERDVELGRELAQAGHGTLHLVRDFHDVAPAVTDIFRDR
ncbi:vWA domain-containing protein [Gryllotalpicola koreensis]|uniref:VWFA domain-containing protein n=1 Tax=Gryllotalpicola koreensis TaxID=993086 RepID=A0ABP7ZRV5_9MICO